MKIENAEMRQTLAALALGALRTEPMDGAKTEDWAIGTVPVGTIYAAFSNPLYPKELL